MPKLAVELMQEYMTQYHLPEYDARILTDDKDTATYFNSLITHTTHYKAAANWILGPVKSYLNEQGLTIPQFPISPAGLAELIELVESGKTNFSVASQTIFPAFMLQPDQSPLSIAERLNVIQSSDEVLIQEMVSTVIATYPEKVAEYRAGKKGLMGLFVGEVIKASKGKADPKVVNKLLNEILS
jgi:aspartyl-tRNA(Asn)/glutamyl-tRNA(Gln) amidotransferase subunit B